jgi:hypothetical protein
MGVDVESVTMNRSCHTFDRASSGMSKNNLKLCMLKRFLSMQAVLRQESFVNLAHTTIRIV